MRYTFLSLILILHLSFSLQAQFYNISFNDPQSKNEIIEDLVERNSFFSSNQHFFFIGTAQRTEFKCNDSTQQSCTFYRKTLFGPMGEIVKDSSINDNKVLTRELIKNDTTWVLVSYVNAIESQRDTLIVDRKSRIRIIKKPKEVLVLDYDPDGRLQSQTTTIPGQITRKVASYYRDSIIVTETTTSKFRKEIRKRLHFFDKRSLLTKDSTFTLFYGYRPPDLNKVASIDTLHDCTEYMYDKRNRHIVTVSRSSTSKPLRFERQFNKDKIALEVNISSENEIYMKCFFEYPDKNTTIEKQFSEGRPTFTNTYRFRKSKIIEVNQINTTFEITQGRFIQLDTQGRIISSRTFQDQEVDWRVIKYVDNK